jgi:hypothetical protein
METILVVMMAPKSSLSLGGFGPIHLLLDRRGDAG